MTSLPSLAFFWSSPSEDSEPLSNNFTPLSNNSSSSSVLLLRLHLLLAFFNRGLLLLTNNEKKNKKHNLHWVANLPHLHVFRIHTDFLQNVSLTVANFTVRLTFHFHGIEGLMVFARFSLQSCWPSSFKSRCPVSFLPHKFPATGDWLICATDGLNYCKVVWFYP